MKRLALAILFLTATLWAADKTQTLNVKTGLWESTITTTAAGHIALPDDLLSRLSPEQRARYEARVKANSGERTRTHTDKSCVTKEKLQSGNLFEADEQCTQTILNSSGSKLQLRVECESERMKSNGTLLLEAIGTENVKGSGTMEMTSSGHKMNSKTSLTAKWVGPSCGELK